MPPTTKSELRHRLLARRDALDPETIAHCSARIHRRLFALDVFRRARAVAFFVATRSEVRTLPMIQEALASGRRVVVPRTILEDRSLRLKEIRHPDADLAPGTLGILEPAAGAPEVPVSEVDLFIVPGAVWDRRGYRIGYGGGFYDRLLVQSPDTPRVGLAFELQVVNRLPEQAHDTPVDWLVTERRVYRFSRPGR